MAANSPTGGWERPHNRFYFARMRSIRDSISIYTVTTPLTICLYGAVVIYVHMSIATNTTSEQEDESASERYLSKLKDRVMGGPSCLSAIDLVFFGTLIVLALELLNFLVKRSRCEFTSSPSFFAKLKPHFCRGLVSATLNKRQDQAFVVVT